VERSLAGAAMRIASSLIVVVAGFVWGGAHAHDSRCDAPPYGDTPAAYKAFAQQFAGFPLGPPTGMLADICAMKFSHADRSTLYKLGLSDKDISTQGTVALAEQQLAALARSAEPPDTRVFAAAICSPGGYCQLQGNAHITGPNSFEYVPFRTLAECQQFIKAGTSGLSPDPDGRTRLPGGSWWECRSKHVDAWEPER
jgi:hypothetical protein